MFFYIIQNLSLKNLSNSEDALKIMQIIDILKPAGIDNLPGKCLKDGTEIPTKPLS